MTLEGDLKAALLLAAPRELPNLRLFNRPILRVRLTDPDRTFRYGVKGQCDLYGVARGGLHVELELKTSTGTMKPKQLVWQEFCRERDIPHLVLWARAGEGVEETVKRWCEEIRTLIRDWSRYHQANC